MHSESRVEWFKSLVSKDIIKIVEFKDYTEIIAIADRYGCTHTYKVYGNKENGYCLCEE